MSTRAVHWVLRSSGITGSQRLTLLTLADFHNEQQGAAWPSVAAMSEQDGLHAATHQRNLRKLEADGVISLERRRGRSCVYRFPALELSTTSSTVLPPSSPHLQHHAIPPLAPCDTTSSTVLPPTVNKPRNDSKEHPQRAGGWLPELLDDLVREVEVPDDAQAMQRLVQAWLTRRGWAVQCEVAVPYLTEAGAERPGGRCDLFAARGDRRLAIEADRISPRAKSVAKLRLQPPGVCRVVLLRRPGTYPAPAEIDAVVGLRCTAMLSPPQESPERGLDVGGAVAEAYAVTYRTRHGGNDPGRSLLQPIVERARAEARDGVPPDQVLAGVRWCAENGWGPALFPQAIAKATEVTSRAEPPPPVAIRSGWTAPHRPSAGCAGCVLLEITDGALDPRYRIAAQLVHHEQVGEDDPRLVQRRAEALSAVALVSESWRSRRAGAVAL